MLSPSLNKQEHIEAMHQTLMLVAWVVLANLGLWCRYFCQFGIFVHLHQMFMVGVLGLSWVAGVGMYLNGGGFGSGLSVGLNLTILLLVAIVALLGSITNKLRSHPSIPPLLQTTTNKLHKYNGWLLLLTSFLYLCTTLQNPQLILVILIDVTSFLAFYILKYRFKPQAKQTSLFIKHNRTEDQMERKILREVRDAWELGVLGGDWFLFEDRVYGVNDVLASHPGGRAIINAIKGREVDRYMYGIQPLELSTISHSHYQSSIKMAGRPLAILYNPNPYQKMPQICQTMVLQITKQCKTNKMYTIYLRSSHNSDEFQFSGYTQLCQLGKYYTVNIYNHVTRLYSCVNFLQFGNLEFMRKVMGQGNGGYGGNGTFGYKLVCYNGEVHQVLWEDVEDLPALPLFVKMRDNGEFTSLVLSGKFQSQIKVSRPRGRGLALHQVKPGRILILAAGTGLNPFCDLIDLLFKQTLISQNHPQSSTLLLQNPLLQSSPLTPFTPTFYISMPQLTFIHPITIYQLNYLAQKNKLQVYIRTKTENDRLYFIYPHLRKIVERFQSVLEEEVGMGGQRVEQVYVCGPVGFGGVIRDEIRRLNLHPSKYRIL